MAESSQQPYRDNPEPDTQTTTDPNQPNGSPEPTPPDAPAPSPIALPKALTLLTPLLLALSPLLLILSILTLTLASIASENSFYISYSVREALNPLIVISILSTVVCATNAYRLRRSRPLTNIWINIIFDIIVAVIGIAYGIAGLIGVIDGSWCGYGGYNRDGCEKWKIIVTVVGSLATVVGIVVGLMHLVLFATRARMGYQSHFWRRPWKLPEGQITFEVSVKMFREPERRVARQERSEQESLV